MTDVDVARLQARIFRARGDFQNRGLALSGIRDLDFMAAVLIALKAAQSTAAIHNNFLRM